MAIGVPNALPVFLLVYFAIRIEYFGSIWDETDLLESKIERDLVNYMVEFLEPYREEMTERLRDIHVHEADAPDRDAIDPEVQEQISEFIENPEEFGDSMEVDWNEVMADAPNPVEYTAEMVQQMAEAIDVSPDELMNGGMTDPFEVRYMLQNDLVDPEEVFSDMSDINYRFRRYRVAKKLSKITIAGMILVSASLTAESMFRLTLLSPHSQYLPVAFVIWIASESWLWMVLDDEVPAEGHTPIRKFLKPISDGISSSLE